MPPPAAPIKKKKFMWTDADENELKDFCKYFITYCYLDLREKRAHIDEN